MATIDIKTAEGKKASTAELADSVFGIEPNVPVMHQVVRMQRASWRAGTHNTKTRGQVRGGGRHAPGKGERPAHGGTEMGRVVVGVQKPLQVSPVGHQQADRAPAGRPGGIGLLTRVRARKAAEHRKVMRMVRRDHAGVQA